MTIRRFLIIGMSAFAAYHSALARPSVLGVVVRANRVHLNATAVTTGATVYDGDRFSTETGGSLRLRSGTTMLELAEASVVSVRSRANDTQGIEVELGKGTLYFSAAQATSLSAIAHEANIRPAADIRTVGQISVGGLKELRIYARRGALQFSYKGETEVIEEGKAYRVILDPPGNESQKDKKEPIRDRKKKHFYFLLAKEE